MSEPNTGRRLAPDSRWLLSIVGTALLAIVSVFQWQLTNSKNEHLRLIENVHQRLDESASHIAKRMETLDVALKQRMDRVSELTLERAMSRSLTRDEVDRKFQVRDEVLKGVMASITDLREKRAEAREAIKGVHTTMERVIGIAVDTQSRSSATQGQLQQLLKQTEANAKLVDRLVDGASAVQNSIRERLSALESRSQAPR